MDLKKIELTLFCNLFIEINPKHAFLKTLSLSYKQLLNDYKNLNHWCLRPDRNRAYP